jgi:hypothetical protein
MRQCKIEDWDVKSYAYAVFRLAVICKSEHRVKRDGTVQAWGQKTLGVIKLKIS